MIWPQIYGHSVLKEHCQARPEVQLQAYVLCSRTDRSSILAGNGRPITANTSPSPWNENLTTHSALQSVVRRVAA